MDARVNVERTRTLVSVEDEKGQATAIHFNEKDIGDDVATVAPTAVVLELEETLIYFLLGRSLCLMIAYRPRERTTDSSFSTCASRIRFFVKATVAVSMIVGATLVPFYLMGLVPAAPVLAFVCIGYSLPWYFILFAHLPTFYRTCKTFEGVYFLSSMVIFAVLFCDCLKWEPIKSFLLLFTIFTGGLFTLSSDASTECNRYFKHIIQDPTRGHSLFAFGPYMIAVLQITVLGILLFMQRLDGMQVRAILELQVDGNVNITFTNASVSLSAMFSFLVFGTKFVWNSLTATEYCVVLRAPLKRFEPFKLD